MPEFKVVSDFQPTGDQPEAIEKLVKDLNQGAVHQTLLGATGTGKTYTILYWDPIGLTWVPLKDFLLEPNGGIKTFELSPGARGESHAFARSRTGPFVAWKREERLRS